MAQQLGRAGVGVIGAGVISAQYLENLTRFADTDVRFVADIDADRAAARAAEFGVRDSGDVDELLGRDDIEVVVNLTLPSTHAEVDRRIVAAGKHVWSEKPIALAGEDAASVLQEAGSAGVLVGVAPDTLLGAGLQTAFRAISEGRIGTPLTATTMVLNPGPDRWHPSPEFLFQAGGGPLLDLGPYYLSTLVAVFGSVARVAASTSTARPQREIQAGPRAGTRFDVEVPTHWALQLDFVAGGSAQSTFSFQSALPRPGFVEITGTEGVLVLPDPNMFDGDTLLYTLDAWRAVSGHETPEPERIPARGATATRGLGVVDLVRAARSGGRPRASGELAAHVLDVMLAAERAANRGTWANVSSRVERPVPVPEDWDPAERTLA